MTRRIVKVSRQRFKARPLLAKRFWIHSIAATSLLHLTSPASAQWVEQSFSLQAGWNTVFVEVDPYPRSLDDILAGLPIETVWKRAEHPLPAFGPDCGSPNDPDCVAPHDTMWRVWFPIGAASEEVKTLRSVEGGRVYAIKATQATVVTFVGTPSGITTAWRPGFNLASFYVQPGSPPTYQDYLAPAPTVGNTVYSLQPDGTLAAVAVTNPIMPGRGAWVSASSDVTYGGPIEIDFGTRSGVRFGKRQQSHGIEFKNLTAAQRQITTTYVPSQPVPGGPQDLPTNAGDVPVHRLEYGSGGLVDEILQWEPLTAHVVAVPSINLNTAPTTLEIGVRRTGLVGAELDENLLGSQYQGVLLITDDAGFRRYVGVTTEVLSAIQGAALGGDVTPRPGLYLGFVTVDHVSWVTAGARVWSNEDATNPEFAGLLQCNGGDNDDQPCFPDRRLCRGTPEIDLQAIVCEANEDCPAGGTCEVITDCPGGSCDGFCVAGLEPCIGSADCPGEGDVCSADLDDQALRPTAAPFQFPVIFHVSDFNEYKLLTEVSLLKEEETGAFVLATPDLDPACCGTLVGALTVNGEPFARRVSTAAFSFADDLTLAGDFASALSANITLAANDPLNPFMHTFHPDHDCVDAAGDPVAGECFETTRSLVFGFEAEPPEGDDVLDWGDSVHGGTYTEGVSGLHRETISAQGRFRIQRVSDIGALNTPVGGERS